mmetsp:Transcript_14227/g.28185  ORF Transcript_14227/g.28185 Transcript_14227/m.28185 type:complete len:204 (-) Transcript_14227:394-1005(-)
MVGNCPLLLESGQDPAACPAESSEEGQAAAPAQRPSPVVALVAVEGVREQVPHPVVDLKAAVEQAQSRLQVASLVGGLEEEEADLAQEASRMRGLQASEAGLLSCLLVEPCCQEVARLAVGVASPHRYPPRHRSRPLSHHHCPRTMPQNHLQSPPQCRGLNPLEAALGEQSHRGAYMRLFGPLVGHHMGYPRDGRILKIFCEP